MDIITKLRPETVRGLVGAPQNHGPRRTPPPPRAPHPGLTPNFTAEIDPRNRRLANDCPPVQRVWVNGARVLFPPVFTNKVSVWTDHMIANEMKDSVIQILESIRPEHVEEMVFHECNDMSVGLPLSNNAIFVTLKPGIVYEQGTGSVVRDSPRSGVDVSDVPSGARALTTETGTVSLMFLPDGWSLVRLKRDGYETQTLSVAIAPEVMTPLTVILKRK